MYTYTYVFMYKYLLAHPLSLVCSTWIPVSVCVCCIAQLMWLAIFGWKRLCRFARSYARLFSAAGIQPIGGFWGPKNTECWIYMLIISVGNHTLTQKLESKEWRNQSSNTNHQHHNHLQTPLHANMGNVAHTSLRARALSFFFCSALTPSASCIPPA